MTLSLGFVSLCTCGLVCLTLSCSLPLTLSFLSLSLPLSPTVPLVPLETLNLWLPPLSVLLPSACSLSLSLSVSASLPDSLLPSFLSLGAPHPTSASLSAHMGCPPRAPGEPSHSTHQLSRSSCSSHEPVACLGEVHSNPEPTRGTQVWVTLSKASATFSPSLRTSGLTRSFLVSEPTAGRERTA